METEQTGGATFERWTPGEVRDALDANQIVLIDVRTPMEYGFEHIDGALNFPMAFFDPKKLPTQDGKRVVLHCGSGLRSEKMGKWALEAGYQRIAHLEGGFTAWKNAKLPYRGTDMASGSPKMVEP